MDNLDRLERAANALIAENQQLREQVAELNEEIDYLHSQFESLRNLYKIVLDQRDYLRERVVELEGFVSEVSEMFDGQTAKYPPAIGRWGRSLLDTPHDQGDADG